MAVTDADTLGPYRKPWLLPVLLVQGKLVKMRALRLPEAEGPRHGATGTDEPGLRLLVVGDSAAAAVGAPRQADGLAPSLADELARRAGCVVAWRVVARSGLAAVDMVDFLVEQLGALGGDAFRADLIVTSLGVNDVMGLTPSADFKAAMERMIGMLREQCGEGVPCVLGRVPPLNASPLFAEPLRGLVAWRIERINGLLAQVASGHASVALASEPSQLDPEGLAEDGFHPNATSYRAWAEHLADVVSAQGWVLGAGLRVN